MSNIRAFFAIDTSEVNKDKISQVQSLLKEIDSGVKWEPKEKFHFTLKFLGNIEETILRDITVSIREEVKNFGEFKIYYSKLGCFPNMKFPRVIWIGCRTENEKIFSLSSIIENIGRDFNFDREKTKFHPHITLGRVKNNKGINEILELMKEINFEETIENISEISVMKSTLKSSGSTYTILDKISLK